MKLSYSTKMNIRIISWIQILVSFLTFCSASNEEETPKGNDRNVTKLLDSLLVGYDNAIRPDFGGPPTVVEIDIMVRSMGPISEVDMSYSMDLYFRQSWLDDRLSYNNSIGIKGTLALSLAFERWIWKPDTAFYNLSAPMGKHSYLHTITTPNKFLRLHQDGRVLYSSRLTIKASCPMNLKEFPMDTQRCPLKLGSFGYTTRDLVYRWNSKRTVVIASDMKMSQFDLISTPSGNITDVMKSGEFSFLVVSFHLQRHTGNFLIEVYGPVSLLVILSWLSFWLNREATADRVSLGVTIILTITFHFTPLSRTDLPKVPYPTALDFFIYLSFAFIYATIIQFAIVHYFTKHGSGELVKDESGTEDETDTEEHKLEAERPSRSIPIIISHMSEVQNPIPKLTEIGEHSQDVLDVHQPKPRRNSNWSFCGKHKNQKTKPEVESANSVSKIDRVSRLLFPLTYIAINVFYFYFYLTSEK